MPHSASIEIYSSIAAFPCDSTALLSVLVTCEPVEGHSVTVGPTSSTVWKRRQTLAKLTSCNWYSLVEYERPRSRCPRTLELWPRLGWQSVGNYYIGRRDECFLKLGSCCSNDVEIQWKTQQEHTFRSLSFTRSVVFLFAIHEDYAFRIEVLTRRYCVERRKHAKDCWNSMYHVIWLPRWLQHCQMTT